MESGHKNPQRLLGGKMKILTALSSIGFVLVSNSVIAADLPQKGQNYFTCETSTLPLGEGHSYTLVKSKGLQTTNDPANPNQIDCYGTVENMPDKTFKASGYCVITDRDGDKWLDRWWADSSMAKGRWEDTGISGKYKNLRGVTGSYVYTDASTPTECRGVSNWEFDKR
jgi:hypothetical protein